MRKSALAIAFFATLSTSVTVQADDFSALLADLSFGDAPALNETLTVTSEVPLVSLQSPVSKATDSIATDSKTAAPDASQSVENHFDLDAAFALQESKAGVPAQTVGHVLHQDDKCGCDAPEPEFVCTPHTPASLPTSSFYQYFRSNKCNTHVWDGYRQPCRHSNAHVNGTCDCFKEKEHSCQTGCGEILECSDCNVPRRHIQLPERIMPVKKNCDAPTSCSTGCDG